MAEASVTARDSRYDVLFEPVQLGPVRAKNRFFLVPHCNGMGYRDPTAQAAMRRVKAEGGWAVVCTEQVDANRAVIAVGAEAQTACAFTGSETSEPVDAVLLVTARMPRDDVFLAWMSGRANGQPAASGRLTAWVTPGLPPRSPVPYGRVGGTPRNWTPRGRPHVTGSTGANTRRWLTNAVIPESLP